MLWFLFLNHEKDAQEHAIHDKYSLFKGRILMIEEKLFHKGFTILWKFYYYSGSAPNRQALTKIDKGSERAIFSSASPLRLIFTNVNSLTAEVWKLNETGFLFNTLLFFFYVTSYSGNVFNQERNHGPAGF